MAANPQFAPPRMLMFTLSELNPELRRDPHALLDAQRAQAIAERDPTIPAVLITAYETGRDMLSDPKLSRNFEHAPPENFIINGIRRVNAAVEAEFGKHETMLVLEDGEHARVRGIVAKAFLARAAQARPLIERVVDAALARLEGRAGFDIVSEYACRIPIHVLGPILGCAEGDLDQLRAWTEAGQSAFDPTRTEEAFANAIAGRRGILGYFRDLIAARRAAPGDDLVSDLIAAQGEGAPISDNEILHNLFALLVAGHLTTADLIGNCVMLLLTHPEARARIEADPALIAPAVDEALRYEPPITQTARFPTSGGEIAGCPYHKGDALTVNLMAANRDPAAWENPHTFDITRRPNPHLAFGAGSHMCVGAPLARLEGQAAVLGLLKRYPKLRRAEEGAPPWRATPGVRGLATFEVAVD
ncbi:MAG: cytochrome P450 [Hyphomonadaceae bacterium]|nr:cytochrome P450 [Hyphomonadaceae bacterium]